MAKSRRPLASLVEEVRACRICAPHLPDGPRPIVQADARARILIAGQAPGRRVHESGVPFDDVSGDRLRAWMGIDRATFYDPAVVAIVPMGFCYPGTGRAGDLPPRAECAPAWRDTLLAHLDAIELTLVIGQYAQPWHLGSDAGGVTETVRRIKDRWDIDVGRTGRTCCRCRTRARAIKSGCASIRGSNETYCRRCAAGSREY